MPSTKSIYKTGLVVCLVCLLLGLTILVLSPIDSAGIAVVITSVIFVFYYGYKYKNVKQIEKKCTVCDARFVCVEKTSFSWKHPRFSIMVEIEYEDKKVLLKTPGVYSASNVSGLSSDSIIRVGYTEKFENVITL